MLTIKVRNVNGALNKGLHELVNDGIETDTRNGPVIRFPYPVMTVYERPAERVLFSPVRNANPVFHLLEALWMLEGRNDVKFPATFVKRMKEFSDDGTIFNGAYGHRWRRHFGYDQLECIITMLQRDPSTRRAVLTMWDAASIDSLFDGGDPSTKALFYLPGADLHKTALGGAKDVPCNTSIYFNVVNNALDMTINCRSNDMIWGAYGANAVHMSVLHEYVARSARLAQGKMYQFSNDLHVYRAVGGDNEALLKLAGDALQADHYRRQDIHLTPLFAEGETQEDFDHDLSEFFGAFDLEVSFDDWRTQFFRFVVDPMVAAWQADKIDRLASSLRHAAGIGAPDWRLATIEWLGRRNSKRGATP